MCAASRAKEEEGSTGAEPFALLLAGPRPREHLRRRISDDRERERGRTGPVKHLDPKVPLSLAMSSPTVPVNSLSPSLFSYVRF